MNQAQRKFLMDKIQENVETRIAKLKETTIEQPPSLENYFYGLALTGKLVIQPAKHIKAVMEKSALNHNSGWRSETWLGTNQGDFIDRAFVKLKIKDLFVVPKEYDQLWDNYKKLKQERDAIIEALKMEAETLKVRIQLASDKTLEKMIAEIDDMGDVSLMDTKLKSLLTGNENKLITEQENKMLNININHNARKNS